MARCFIVYCSLAAALFLFSYASSKSSIRCHPAERRALLRLTSSIYKKAWQDPDCCLWKGIKCDEKTGNVISLYQFGVGKIFHSANSSLYDLRFLQSLEIEGLFSEGEKNFIPPEIEKLSQLKHLFLTNFGGRIPDNIGNLTHLETLWFDYYNLIGSIPSSLANLHKITSFALINIFHSLTKVPSFIFGLPNFENTHSLTKLPSFIFDLPNIEILVISSSDFEGSIPTSLPLNLRVLDLSSNKLTGYIPAAIGNLKQLQSLRLVENNFTGNIPLSVFELPRIDSIDLSWNRFEGSLPESIPIDSKITSIYLNDNKLSGRVPSWVFNGLVLHVHLQNNRFSGPIMPFQKPLVSYVIDVDLSNNLIEGFPISLFYLCNISDLALGDNNLSSVFLIHMIKDMTGLRNLNFSGNQRLSISNEAARDLPTFDIFNQFHLYMEHCNITEFPNFLGDMKGLFGLSISNNKMTGTIDISKTWDNTWILEASFNYLEGPLMAAPKSLQDLDLSHNHLSGGIPENYCNLTRLNLAFNNLSGVIPWTTASCFPSPLENLNLNGNNFHGAIPGVFPNIRLLLLNGNKFSSKLPRSLNNSINLACLDVGNNNITDVFPNWLGENFSLNIIIIASNNFHGRPANVISSSKIPFQNLKILDASHNMFTGYLPMQFIGNYQKWSLWTVPYFDSWIDQIYITIKGSKYTFGEIYRNHTIVFERESYNPQIFTILDLSYNMFSGRIPSAMGKVRTFIGLNLNDNNLSGEIPLSFGNLASLESLDLSSNILSGSIPMQFLALKSLVYMNLSYNSFEGSIPSCLTFTNDSYIGNTGLCGFPISKIC